MSDQFFERPIINSPYDYPNKYWELDESGQPTQRLLDSRRKVEFLTPIPKPKRVGRGQSELDLEQSLDDSDQRYHSGIISVVREQVAPIR